MYPKLWKIKIVTPVPKVYPAAKLSQRRKIRPSKFFKNNRLASFNSKLSIPSDIGIGSAYLPPKNTTSINLRRRLRRR